MDNSGRKSVLLMVCLGFVTMLMWGQNWELVWSDEFDGESLDASKWSYQTGTGSSEGLSDWGNNELQTPFLDQLSIDL